MLIGEYDSSGNAIAEYVYFGLRAVAIKVNGSLNIVHTDYLGTPRVVTNGGSIVWQWKNDNPYGYNQALGSIEFNLRFAGQYYDYESGLHYNIHRTYNPEIGRYMQSDPIGLAGGSNTYNYVGRNPLDSVDPLGLDRLILNFSSNIKQGFFTDLIKNQTSLPDNAIITVGHGLLSGGMVVDMHSPAMLALNQVDPRYYNQIAKLSSCTSTYECTEDSKSVSGLTFAIIISKITKNMNTNQYKEVLMTECHGENAPYIDMAPKILGKQVRVSRGTVVISVQDEKSYVSGVITGFSNKQESEEFEKLSKIDMAEAIKYIEGLSNFKKGINNEDGFKVYK